MRSAANARLAAGPVMHATHAQAQAETVQLGPPSENAARKEELPSNGRFSQWSGAAPANWVVGESVRVERETRDTVSARFAVRLTGAGPISLEAHWLSQRKVFTADRPYIISVSAKRIRISSPTR